MNQIFIIELHIRVKKSMNVKYKITIKSECDY